MICKSNPSFLQLLIEKKSKLKRKTSLPNKRLHQKEETQNFQKNKDFLPNTNLKIGLK